MGLGVAGAIVRVVGAVVRVVGAVVRVVGAVVCMVGTVVSAMVGCGAQPCVMRRNVNPVKINVIEIFILLSP